MTPILQMSRNNQALINYKSTTDIGNARYPVLVQNRMNTM